jgi:hypothetical protein
MHLLDDIVYLPSISRLCYIKEITKDENDRFEIKVEPFFIDGKNNKPIIVESMSTLEYKIFHKSKKIPVSGKPRFSCHSYFDYGGSIHVPGTFVNQMLFPIEIEILKSEKMSDINNTDYQKIISSHIQQSDKKIDQVIKNYLLLSNNTLIQSLLYNNQHGKIVTTKTPLKIFIDYEEYKNLLTHPITIQAKKKEPLKIQENK